MKQDIRDLFKEDDASEHALPKHHRQEFYDKLKATRPQRQSKLNTSYLFKVAVLILVFLAFTIVMFNQSDTLDNDLVEEAPIETQIEVIERQYLANIDKEWQSFLSITDDEKLVKRYREKLEDLNKDYKVLSKQFKANSDNITIIEALVENLQIRLQLLKDIQEHIKLLNQKNEQYETINI